VSATAVRDPKLADLATFDLPHPIVILTKSNRGQSDEHIRTQPMAGRRCNDEQTRLARAASDNRRLTFSCVEVS
jgi:hypothetical protein